MSRFARNYQWIVLILSLAIALSSASKASAQAVFTKNIERLLESGKKERAFDILGKRLSLEASKKEVQCQRVRDLLEFYIFSSYRYDSFAIEDSFSSAKEYLEKCSTKDMTLREKLSLTLQLSTLFSEIGQYDQVLVLLSDFNSKYGKQMQKDEGLNFLFLTRRMITYRNLKDFEKVKSELSAMRARFTKSFHRRRLVSEQFQFYLDQRDLANAKKKMTEVISFAEGGDMSQVFINMMRNQYSRLVGELKADLATTNLSVMERVPTDIALYSPILDVAMTAIELENSALLTQSISSLEKTLIQSKFQGDHLLVLNLLKKIAGEKELKKKAKEVLKELPALKRNQAYPIHALHSFAATL